MREKACELRRQGYVYSEILKVVPVAKSTLSLWFRDVGLAKAEKQKITQKRIDAQKKGARAKHEQRVKLTKDIQEKARKEIGKISKRELWLLGIALYWAEGSKEKERYPGSSLRFSNSDHKMVRLFIQWLESCAGVSKDEIYCNLYIHETHQYRIAEVVYFWSNATGLPVTSFGKTYLKKNKIGTKRKNIGNLYNGVLRVSIRSSSSLNRKIVGWIQGIVNNWGIV